MLSDDMIPEDIIETACKAKPSKLNEIKIFDSTISTNKRET
jgi:hypothetical protein